ncbi:phage major capsid protein [Gottfriedia sp. NPDC057948]|uniref:phage major capsid protein n=1 Tax=Gottfriedia sp. NPDC057948 TaxID=3346287 RepID=UPI0036DAA002
MSNQKFELRMNDSTLVSENELTVSGYVNKTEQFSEVLGSSQKFREKISKGAFARAITNRTRDIDFLDGHKHDRILSSTKNNSLKLEEDSVGLKMTATITPTSWGKDTYELIKSGIYRNMSFGFRVIKDTWNKTTSGIYERTVHELELFEVSAVKDPAYSQSTIAARAIDIVEDPEIKNIEDEKKEVKELPLSLRIAKLESQIIRQEDEVHLAENTLKIKPVSLAFKEIVLHEKSKLSNLQNELRNLQTKMEEKEMKNEERALVVEANGAPVSPKLVDQIVKKLESTSKVYDKTRKILFKGLEMKIPYETNLDLAKFIDEGSDVPELALNLNNFSVMKQKRVGLSLSMSKQLMFDSGVDLSQQSKELLVRRVGKAIEKSILTGTAANEFKGIAPDASVISKDFSLAAPTALISNLRKVYLSVHEDVIENSFWIMSRPFFEKIADFKDTNGNYFVKQIELKGKIVFTLFGAPIEISSSLAAGDTIGQVPVLFGSIEDCYTVGITKGLEVKVVTNDTINALRGSASVVAEFYGDGRVHNYSAIAKGTVIA